MYIALWHHLNAARARWGVRSMDQPRRSRLPLPSDLATLLALGRSVEEELDVRGQARHPMLSPGRERFHDLGGRPLWLSETEPVNHSPLRPAADEMPNGSADDGDVPL